MNDNNEWDKYIAEGDDYVSVDRWGKDHWSLLAYLESVAVDYGGKVDNLKMRVDPRVHLKFAHHASRYGGDSPSYLKGGERLEKHDDFSCMEDLVAAEFIHAFTKDKSESEIDNAVVHGGLMSCRIELTDMGRVVSAALRKHKSDGGQFAEFEWNAQERFL